MEELLAKIQKDLKVHMLLLNDDIPQNSEILRMYHVQDPAQTNSKDMK